MIAEKIKLPIVSVAIITYNQQHTIAQTIDSIISQKGDFDLDVVIGEDFSSDDTRKICLEYKDKFPDIINLVLQESNQGLVKNFIDTIKSCKGDFIAVCAGDDYWIDDQKIKKQIEFLNAHHDFGVVSTNGYKLYVKQNKLVKGLPPLNPIPDGNVFHKTYIGGVYAMPLSVLFKSELLKFVNFDEFISRKFSVEDVPLQAILAKHTKFGHIDDLCVVYRVYSTSLTFTNFNNDKYLNYHQGLVAIRKYLDELYPGEVGYSDSWANDYLTYRKFLVATFNFNYHDAKFQISNLIVKNRKAQRAKFFVSNIFVFYFFCIIKMVKLKFSTFGK